MSQHYTSNTSAVMHYCPTCNKNTMHNVFNKRLGRCQNSHVSDKKPDPEKTDSLVQTNLF